MPFWELAMRACTGNQPYWLSSVRYFPFCADKKEYTVKLLGCPFRRLENLFKATTKKYAELDALPREHTQATCGWSALCLPPVFCPVTYLVLIVQSLYLGPGVNFQCLPVGLLTVYRHYKFYFDCSWGVISELRLFPFFAHFESWRRVPGSWYVKT